MKRCARAPEKKNLSSLAQIPFCQPARFRKKAGWSAISLRTRAHRDFI